MSNLYRYITQQQESINHCLETIADLQQQLNELNQRLRVEQQLCQARETAEKEVNDWLKQGQKLMKDLCGVFPVEALQDLADEVTTLTEEVAQDYEQHATSGRFLKPVEETPDFKDFTLISQQLPNSNDDTTLLSAPQIQTVISQYEPDIIQLLKKQWNINGRIKSYPTIATKLAELKLFTYLKLTQALSDAQRESERYQLLQNTSPQLLNGKS